MSALEDYNIAAPTNIINATYSSDEFGSKAGQDEKGFVTPTPQRQFNDLRPKRNAPSGPMKNKDKKRFLSTDALSFDSNMENIPIPHLAPFDNRQCMRGQKPFRMFVRPRVRRHSITDDCDHNPSTFLPDETFPYLE